MQSECELNLWSGCFQVVASQSYSRGQQVFMSYGSQSNDALLQLYGFVEDRNPADRYVVPNLAAVMAKQWGLKEVDLRAAIPAVMQEALSEVCVEWCWC